MDDVDDGERHPKVYDGQTESAKCIWRIQGDNPFW